MMVKVFKSDGPTFLEEEINQWLGTGQYDIKLIRQSTAQFSTVISVWYEDDNLPDLPPAIPIASGGKKVMA